VLIPIEGYEFFPRLQISDYDQNATLKFSAFSSISRSEGRLAYKYYQRYPERRITCLDAEFNDRSNGARVAVFLRAEHTNGSVGYYVDLVRQAVDFDFMPLCHLLFGSALEIQEGLFLLRDIDSPEFAPDDALDDLLSRFDDIRARGWIDSLREGDTGVGHTFESLVGITENNDKRADFRGIEIKCSKIKGSQGRSGKINLFQQAPVWVEKMSGMERLRFIGQPDINGVYACHSQVTIVPNNLGLLLDLREPENRIDLLKNNQRFGKWPFDVLEQRLREKHSRAVFVKARASQHNGSQKFRYEELVYCQQPSMARFNELVRSRGIVFEFLMSEENNRVRNHGYPWRLTSGDYLSDLFAFQVRLR
jgi:hypothetical protein